MEIETETDDLAAVHRTLAGDPGAFRSVVERYGPRLLGFLRARIGSEEEARDAAQEVFLRAYRSLGSYRLGESFPSWLFAIAANRGRTRQARLRTDEDRVRRAKVEAAVAPLSDPAFEAERSVEAEAIRGAVRLLPEEQRRAVELHYFGGLSVADAARVLGIGQEAVKSRLFRARARLAGILRDRGKEDGRPFQPPAQRGGAKEGILP